MAAPRPAVLAGALLAGLIVASHGVLHLQVAETNEVLRAIVGAQRGEPVPGYTAGDGTSTYGSGVAGAIEVTAPDGTLLEGEYVVDLIGGRLVVISDDGQRVARDVDPEDFRGWNAMSDASVELTQTMLLGLHGWPRERWPDGWAPR